MADEPIPARSKRQRGPYSRMICLGCQQRRIRCELPNETEVPGPGECLNVQTPCYRCNRLGIPCIVRQTVLGRPSTDDSSMSVTELPSVSSAEPPARLTAQANRWLSTPQEEASLSISATPGCGTLSCPEDAPASGTMLSKPGDKPYHYSTQQELISPSSFSPRHAGTAPVRPEKVQILPLRRPPALVDSDVPRKSTQSDSSDSQTTKTKHARASKPKVRTGCLTCKIRRVKCDETKPACIKCGSTGRRCDGYTEPPPRKRKYQNVNSSLPVCPVPTRGLALSALKTTSSESRGLEYFCVRTAPYMGMYFDGDFWSSLILQASIFEPAIAHVMVAVGVFAERRESLDTEGQPASQARPGGTQWDAAALNRKRISSENDPVALINYNKSISLLKRYSSSENTETVLLAAILFVCVEFLRGNDEAALQHFKGGMAIIMQTFSRADSSPSAREMANRIKATIMPFFNRLEMLYMLFGNDTAWPYHVTLEESIPATFSSVKQARESIVHLMNLSLHFVRSMGLLKYSPSPLPSSAIEGQAALLCHLESWRSVFSAYQTENASQLTSSDIYASNVLEIHCIIASIWVSVCTSPFESANDEHISSFTKAVTLAEQLSSSAAVGTSAQRARYSNTFLLDMEIVGPIHWVSIKCRDPSVRRRAIAVQRSTQRREGIWDSKVTAAVAESVMAAEEAGLDVGHGELPCEAARVHFSNLDWGAGISPVRTVITHQTKPYGVYAEWHVWQEVVWYE